MKSLYRAADLDELRSRIAAVRPDSPRLWGSMTAAQALAHCSRGIQMASGELLIPRALIGRILGPLVKPSLLRSDEPMRRNSPTAKQLIISNQPDLGTEQTRLIELLDRFHTAGPQGCTRHPHVFFGPLKPDEWGILLYKHIDHHLRQFSA